MRAWIAWALLVASGLGALNADAQTAADVNEGLRLVRDEATGGYNLCWWGRAGRKYFFEASDDMMHWHYLPALEGGHDAVIEYGFASTATRYFLRLKHTPDLGPDTDGDTLDDFTEILIGTDPFRRADTDGDGYWDDEETAYGSDPNDDNSQPGMVDGVPGDLMIATRFGSQSWAQTCDYYDGPWDPTTTSTRWRKTTYAQNSTAGTDEIISGTGIPAIDDSPASAGITQWYDGDPVDPWTASLPPQRAYAQTWADLAHGRQITGTINRYAFWLQDGFELRLSTRSKKHPPVNLTYVLEEKTGTTTGWYLWGFNDAVPPALTPFTLGLGTDATLGGTYTYQAPVPAAGTAVAANVRKPDIVPDDGMAGVIGDVVASALPGSTVKHFVTPRQLPDPVTHHVYLKASGVTPEQMTAGNVLRRYQWDADGGQVVQDAPDKWRVSRSATGSGPVTVKLKTLGGTVVAQMEVWVVWCDPPTVTVGTAAFNQVTRPIIANGVPIGNENMGAAYNSTALWKFKFAIKPASICDPGNLERPELSGSKGEDPPGANNDYSLNPAEKADNATLKWDVSRQIKVTMRNPNSIPKASLEQGCPLAFCVNQPTPDDSPVNYPSNPAEGNDDPDLGAAGPDEDDNPYRALLGGNLSHGVGELTSIDAPGKTALKSWGAAGYHFGVEFNFREFCRLEISDGKRTTGTFWYRISDYADWHFYFSTDFDDTAHEWHDAAAPAQSNTNSGHSIP